MDLNSTSSCIICEKNDNVPLFYGDFLKKSNIGAHYFCLLFSYNLQQLGKDNSGILGFQIKDIKKYVKSIRDNVCIYCSGRSASVKCYKCEKYFHLICGFENKCHFQFIGLFKSYCHLHIQIKHEYSHLDNQSCGICLQVMGVYHPVLSIAPKCCAKKWFHRSCLMRYALSAGYYVKCMWCQKKEFRDQIRLDGIFVPDRDASWEKEPNAYSDLHRPHRKCVAEDCLCPKGKEYNNSSSRLWAIILCCMCGAYPLHVGCYQSSTGMVSSDFVCNDCQLIRTYISLNAAPCDMNNANKTQDLNLAEDNVELSQLDKSLYLVKTLNYDDFQTYHDNRSTNSTKESLKCGIDSQNSVAKILHDTVCNNENFDIANSISSNSSQKINLKQYLDGFIQTDKQNAKVHGYYIEHANNWVEFCFEKETLRGTIIGTLISPKSIKYKYSIDEIIPKIIKLYGKTDSSSDSETDVECEEIFISVLKDELKKNGISTENLRKQKIRNKVKVRKHTKKYFLQSQKRENLKAIVTANSLKNDKLDEKFDLDKIKIEKLLFFETELHSDSSPTESEEELFQKILENEIKKEYFCIKNQKEQVRRISF